MLLETYPQAVEAHLLFLDALMVSTLVNVRSINGSSHQIMEVPLKTEVVIDQQYQSSMLINIISNLFGFS